MGSGRLLATATAATLHLGAAVLVLLVPAGNAVPVVPAPALRLFEVAAIPAVSPETPPPPARVAPAADAPAAASAVPPALPAALPVMPLALPAGVRVSVPASATNAAGDSLAATPAAIPGAAAASRTALRDRYARELWQHILAWKPPGATISGTAVVQFVVDRGGALRELALAQSSGSTRLDRIALRSVRLASPMPAPPAELGDDDLNFSLAFSFG